jgi:hypothetical protein
MSRFALTWPQDDKQLSFAEAAFCANGTSLLARLGFSAATPTAKERHHVPNRIARASIAIGDLG